MHSWSTAPMHDLAIMGLILLFVGTVFGVALLWEIYKTLTGLWADYRKVNRLDYDEDDP